MNNAIEAAEPKNAPAILPPRLPYHPAIEERFGVGLTEWRALVDAVFPLAKEPSSVILALSYCKARNLDPFKRPVHIVPMWNSAAKRMCETVWPGIGELRTTAFRTGQYAGRDEAKYGETKNECIGSVGVQYPEWCQVTVYRLLGGQRLPFPGPRVYWKESYATAGRDDPSPNAMWRRRPFGQIDKCAEAAALRAAFPEEVGNEYAAEEMEGKILGDTIDNTTGEVRPTPRSLAERMDMLAAGPADDAVTEQSEPQQESELMPSEPVPAGEDVEPLRSPEEQSAAGGAEHSTAEQYPDVPPAPVGDPKTKTLADYDTDLATAAQRGIAALHEAWSAVPAGMKQSLKAALDRRHKPAAAAVDDASKTSPADAADQPASEPQCPTGTITGGFEAGTAEPTTEAEYVDHATAWLKAVASRDAALAQWTREKNLRNACNVSPEVRDQIKKKLDAIFA